MADWPQLLALHQFGTRPSRTRPDTSGPAGTPTKTIFVLEFEAFAFFTFEELLMDAVEKFVADVVALGVTDTAKIAAIEAAMPPAIDGLVATVKSVIALVEAVRAATK